MRGNADVWPAAQALAALARGEDTAEADAGALLIADFLFLVRSFLTKR